VNRRWLPVVVTVSFVLAVALLSSAAVSAPTEVVGSIYDGDTLTLTSGKRVRLLQIDTPELGSGESYSRAARTALLQRVPIGSRVRLESDPRLDKVDRYGRLLRLPGTHARSFVGEEGARDYQKVASALSQLSRPRELSHVAIECVDEVSVDGIEL